MFVIEYFCPDLRLETHSLKAFETRTITALKYNRIQAEKNKFNRNPQGTLTYRFDRLT